MMKRTTILLALFALSLHGMAQVRFLDIYQNGKITRSLATTDVDSINVSGDGTSRMVNFFQGSNLINSYRASTVDSIKVYRPELEPLVYMGIVAFNQELYEKPIGVLSLSSVNSYKSFVSEQSMKDGTLLYYGVDDILDMLTSYDFETKLKKVYLVTFTDGLDQGSLMMNWDYSSSKEYLAAVSRRIRNTRVQNLPITAYSLGLRGSDVTDYAMFQNNLKQLASSDDKAFEVNSMSDVRTRLREIASTINSSTSTTSTTNTQTLRMKIPGVGNGTRICFTFDGNDPTSSSIYIEGTFNLQDRTLTNIVYRGISGVTTGTTVQGIQDGIFVTFTFNFVLHQAISGSEIVPTKNIREYYKGPTATSWQRNSEFTPANNAQTDTKTTVTVKRSGAAVFLLLDCSSSLSSQFSDMKSYANEFIQYIADNTVSNTVSAPDNVKAELDFVDDAFQINVRWNAVKYASSYNVYRSYSSSGTFTKVAEGVKTASWTDDSPLSGYNYYKVEAVGYGLTSPRSSAVGAFKPFSKDMGETFLVNGVSFNMIKVSGGTFLMGKSADGNDVTPVHNVTLSDYYIGETEVTQELWQAVMGSNPSYFYGNKMPVQQVNWNDCQTFIQKLNQLTGKKFRLPTEAEWEFAAKGGTKSKDYTYSGSDAIDDVAWYGDVTGRTHEVATKAPNELGIYDMSGNVWEWCRDWYDSYSSSPQTNPTGPSSGSFRVYRGGCWYGNASYCRTAFRSDNFPTFSNKYIGLRLAQ